MVPISLPFTKFSTNERKVLLARSFRSKGDEIDVFAIDLIWGSRFARWADPLERYFPKPYLEQILSYSLQSCYIDGKLMAIPFYVDVGLMYYRKDLVARFPAALHLEERLHEGITWQEVLDLQRYPAAADKPLFLFAAKDFEGLICFFVEMVYGQGGSFYSQDSLNFDTPAGRRSLQLMVDLVNKYHFAPLDITEYDEVGVYFHAIQNDALLFRGWPAYTRHHRDSLVAYGQENDIGMAPLPNFGETPGQGIIGGWNLMLSKYSRHKAEAITFIRFLLRPENQRRMFELGGYIPVSQTVYQDSNFMGKHPDLSYLRELVAQGAHRPYSEDYTRVSDILSYYLHLAIRKDLAVREALQKATRDINSGQVVFR